MSNPPPTDPNPQKTTKATFTNHVSTYQAALNSLFSGSPSQTESDLSFLFTLTFIQRSDNSTRDFPAFVQHIKWLREILEPGSVNVCDASSSSSPTSKSQPTNLLAISNEQQVTVTHFLRSGNQIAERHSGDPVTLPDGPRQCGETFMWVQVAEDGRIEWRVETVKKSMIGGGEGEEEGEEEAVFPLR